MLAGRRRDMGLGALHTVSLADAREEARRCRQVVRKGIDPIEDRKTTRLTAEAETLKVMTFRQCAEAYIKAHEAGWKNDKHGAQWTSTLATYAYPALGPLSVAAVDTGLVMKVLEPIWATKTETASRVRGRVEAILDWATVRKHRTGENPARWKGQLNTLALDVEFPTMVDAAKATIFVAAEEHWRTPVRAEGIDQANLSIGVAERDQILTKQADSD